MSEKQNDTSGILKKSYGITEDYFYRMLSAEALRYSEPYNEEEEKVLGDFLKSHPDVQNMNLVVVGSGELWYLRFGLEYAKDYVSIEPLQDAFLNDSVKYLASSVKKVFLINKPFGQVTNADLPSGPSIYVFFFNILSYVDDPVGEINKIVEEGDIVFISTWNTTKLAKYVRRAYFDFLNASEKSVVVDPSLQTHILDMEKLPVKDLKYYKGHERITGEITDIIIVRT